MSPLAVEAKFLRYAAPALGDRAAALADRVLRGAFDARFALG
jgi:hypothetical protein